MALLIRFTINLHLRVQYGWRPLVIHIQWYYDCSHIHNASPRLLLRIVSMGSYYHLTGCHWYRKDNDIIYIRYSGVCASSIITIDSSWAYQLRTLQYATSGFVDTIYCQSTSTCAVWPQATCIHIQWNYDCSHIHDAPPRLLLRMVSMGSYYHLTGFHWYRKDNYIIYINYNGTHMWCSDCCWNAEHICKYQFWKIRTFNLSTICTGRPRMH